jgi:hypothetical protein
VADFDNVDENIRRLEELATRSKKRLEEQQAGTRRITINKQTHRIKFENETEDSVDVVIEKKEHK